MFCSGFLISNFLHSRILFCFGKISFCCLVSGFCRIDLGYVIVQIGEALFCDRGLHGICQCDILGNCKNTAGIGVCLIFLFYGLLFRSYIFLSGFYSRFRSGNIFFCLFQSVLRILVCIQGCFGSFVCFLERCYSRGFSGNFLCGCIFLSLQFLTDSFAFARASSFCFSSALASARAVCFSFRAAAF